MISWDRFALLLIGVGVVLTATPAAVFSADIGEPTYTFEATEISHEDGAFSYGPQIPISTFRIDNFACVGGSRSCEIERYIHENGAIPVENTDWLSRYYEFAYIDGAFYRAETREENSTTYLTHERVSAAIAFRNSSTSYSIAAPAYQRAVDQGHATTTEPLDAPVIIAKDTDTDAHRFYYLYPAKTPPAGRHGPGLDDRIKTYGLSATAFLTGLALILRGQRIRVRRT